jgi:hypothetical protein
VKDAQDVFRVTQRAQIVFGNDKGEVLEIKTIDNETFLTIYLQNKGHVPAHNVEMALNMLVAPPDMTLQYRELNGVPGFFNPGVTIGPSQQFTGYLNLGDSTAVSRAKTKKVILRLVGRVRYADDFGTYCDPFAVGYKVGPPPRFESEFMPPHTAVCDLNSPDSETLSADAHGVYHVNFHVRKGESLSPEQPQPPK